MKKKLILLAGSLFAIAAVTTTVVAINLNNETSLLAMNVEALAQGELFYGEEGCLVWDSTCYGVVATPNGNYGVDYPNRKN